MSASQKNQQIKELLQQMSTLKEQKSKLDVEAEELAEKRNRFNEQSKKLHAEILELKTKRDALNQQVKELKAQREKTKVEINEKIEELRELGKETQALTRKKSFRTSQSLEKEIKNIEWKIQTTSLTLKEEKELVEKVKNLESQLNVYKEIEELKQKKLVLKAQTKSLQINNKSYHEQLTCKAQRSMEIHKKMIEKIEELKKVKAEADKFHKLFLETRLKTKPLQDEILKISNQIKQLKESIKVEENQERERSERSLKEILQSQAKEKMRRGEKLTWEEFQLLAEDETQN